MVFATRPMGCVRRENFFLASSDNGSSLGSGYVPLAHHPQEGPCEAGPDTFCCTRTLPIGVDGWVGSVKMSGSGQKMTTNDTFSQLRSPFHATPFVYLNANDTGKRF